MAFTSPSGAAVGNTVSKMSPHRSGSLLSCPANLHAATGPGVAATTGETKAGAELLMSGIVLQLNTLEKEPVTGKCGL